MHQTQGTKFSSGMYATKLTSSSEALNLSDGSNSEEDPSSKPVVWTNKIRANKGKADILKTLI